MDSVQIPLWHAKDKSFALSYYNTSDGGLSPEEAKVRLRKYGPNSIPYKSSDSILRILWRQIHNPAIYSLIFASLLAVMLGKLEDCLVILAVVVCNTLIGFFQEHKAHRTIQALSCLIPKKATVIRGGKIGQVAAYSLVVGDIVSLEAGDQVPADLRLTLIKNLQCDESMLTGESHPVHKKIGSDPENALLADRKSMAFNGTYVTSGRALGCVVATGAQTEFGKISGMLAQIPFIEPPLSIAMKKAIGKLTYLIVAIGLALFVVGFLRGNQVFDAALSAIALAVAAVPEGLPAIITISAAIGVVRMAKKNAIIRQLPAVEALGSTNVICTDKTGTLTYNKMVVEQVWTPSDDTMARQNTLSAAIICSDASKDYHAKRSTHLGDPTEIALIHACEAAHIDERALAHSWPRLDTMPFESERRLMATLNSHEGGRSIFMKGAPEEILLRCSLDEQEKAKIQTAITEMSQKGMRLLAVAKKEVTTQLHALTDNEIKTGMTFLGLLALFDPPRQEVYQALKACHDAKICVKMITGDHPLTAEAIAKDLGLLETGRVITGHELSNLTDEEWTKIALENNVFARALPEHKLKLVETLQKAGCVVAMTGDGVNDAPALKRAEIGVAMGIKGTAVAKEASDMILTDDNFASIEAAVEEGRRVYDNLVKAFSFILPTSIGQALVIFLGVCFFPVHNGVLVHPILPVQILWVNLIVATALSLPLALEEAESNIMHRPPRKREAPLFNKALQIKMVTVSLFMALSSLALFMGKYLYEIGHNVAENVAMSQAQTLAVTALIFFQVFYLFNCRRLRESIKGPSFFSNPAIFIGIALVIGAQIAFCYLRVLNGFFNSSPLTTADWLIAALVSFLVIPMTWIEKAIWKIST